jgi:hypothetical protein
MSVSIEHPVSENHFPNYDPFRALSERVQMYFVQCHYCGYEPGDLFAPMTQCPKCHGSSWERCGRPLSLLELSERGNGPRAVSIPGSSASDARHAGLSVRRHRHAS